jgi:poly(A) polymerase
LDKYEPLHCCYFLGLRRKHVVCDQKGEPFDIRFTVEEFKNSVGWGSVHLTRNAVTFLDLFVFLGGVQPAHERPRTFSPLQAVEGVAGSKRKRDESDTVRG